MNRLGRALRRKVEDTLSQPSFRMVEVGDVLYSSQKMRHLPLFSEETGWPRTLEGELLNFIPDHLLRGSARLGESVSLIIRL
jgi:hypothetical protein